MQGSHKNRSPEEDCHGNGALGICSRAIKLEVLRKAVMGMGQDMEG